MAANNIDELAALFFTAGRLLRNKLFGDCKKIGQVSFLQLITLKYIYKNTDPTMKDVAGFLSITPASVSALIDGLVKTDLIERVPDPVDGRVIHLSLTIMGRKKLEESFGRAKSIINLIFLKLNAGERKKFFEVFKKLSEIIPSVELK